MTRAKKIVTLAGEMGIDSTEIWTMMQETLDGNLSTDFHVAIRDRFSGDDDFDDFQHAVDHELGLCDDGDDCELLDM